MTTHSASETRLARCQRDLAEALILNPALADVFRDAQTWNAFVTEQSPEALEHSVDLPRLSPERLELYNDLIHATWREVLSSIYPHTRRFFPETWSHLLTLYRRQHPVSEYHLYRVAEAFPRFIETFDCPELVERRAQCPFLAELALYEWLEVAVQRALPKPLPESYVPYNLTALEPENLTQWIPVWNADCAFHVFNVPVPSIIDVIRTHDSLETLLEAVSAFKTSEVCCPTVIYRKPGEHGVTFYVLTPLLAAYFQVTQDFEMTYSDGFQWLREHVPSLSGISNDQLLEQGIEMLKSVSDAQILRGSISAA